MMDEHVPSQTEGFEGVYSFFWLEEDDNHHDRTITTSWLVGVNKW